MEYRYTRGYSLGKGGERRGERGEGATSFLTSPLLPLSLLLTYLSSFINLKMISSLDVLQFMVHYNIITRNK